MCRVEWKGRVEHENKQLTLLSLIVSTSFSIIYSSLNFYRMCRSREADSHTSRWPELKQRTNNFRGETIVWTRQEPTASVRRWTYWERPSPATSSFVVKELGDLGPVGWIIKSLSALFIFYFVQIQPFFYWCVNIWRRTGTRRTKASRTLDREDNRSPAGPRSYELPGRAALMRKKRTTTMNVRGITSGTVIRWNTNVQPRRSGRPPVWRRVREEDIW